MFTRNKSDYVVADVMLSLDLCPIVANTTILKEVLESMDQHRLGVVCITNDDGYLDGIMTEGDMRRLLLRVQKPLAAIMADDVGVHAVRHLSKITPDTPLAEAVSLMGVKRVWDLPVVDAEDKLVGLLHLHQAILAVMSN
jgi:arabinose-5-phosphate isomerase